MSTPPFDPQNFTTLPLEQQLRFVTIEKGEPIILYGHIALEVQIVYPSLYEAWISILPNRQKARSLYIYLVQKHKDQISQHKAAILKLQAEVSRIAKACDVSEE